MQPVQLFYLALATEGELARVPAKMRNDEMG